MKLLSPFGPAGMPRRYNATLHGRSVYRHEDVPGHNVFKGYNSPGTGDALDLFTAGGMPVYAPGDCTQTQHRNDATRLEVVYLEGDGWLAVYAHINAKADACGVRFGRGDVVGYVRKDLADPHLHFELWLFDRRSGWAPISGQSPGAYIRRLRTLCGLPV